MSSEVKIVNFHLFFIICNVIIFLSAKILIFDGLVKSNTIFFVNLQKNKIVMKDSVIIVSGGLDSITLLYDKAETIALAISFDYGQNHGDKELPYAQYHCEKLGIPHITIPLSFMHQYFKSSLLDGADAIPEGHYEEENMKSTVVPFRNGIMLAIATGIAESHELKRVYIANHGGDHTIYPDCRPEFIHAMNGATEAGTFVKVCVEAPYTEITKTEIVARGAALGIDYSKTWSCYKGADIHCGKCGTCVERKEAFEAAGVKDPTIYSKE
jgi:protein ExsB